jgi:peptide/nickel transport system substrate-binding protein
MTDVNQDRLSQSRRDFLRHSAALGAVTFGGGVLAACSTASPVGPGGATGGGQGGQLPRNETLFVNGFQWGPPTNFNPLNPAPAWPASLPAFAHLYETLFGFNLLTGELDPMLGEKLTWDGTDSVTVTVHQAAAWHDGKPVTADDVVYSFELQKKYPELTYAAVWDYVSKVTKVDDRTVRFDSNPDQANPGMVNYYLGWVRIIPQHIWEKIEEKEKSLIEYTNMDPVGSGPYKLSAHSQQSVTLERHEDYWGKETFGTAGPRIIVHPIFKDNNQGNLAFQRGEIDVSQQFLPEVWKLWQERGMPASTWWTRPPYHIPGSMPMLMINVHKKPFDDTRVRRALAHAINYEQIAKTAMSRYSVTAMASLVLPQGPEAKHFNEEKAKSGWSYNPDKAAQILEDEVGAKRGSDGVYELPDGTRLGTFTVQTPNGWTDWMTAIELVAQGAKDAGIDIRTKFPEAPTVTAAVQNGNFDLALWSVAGTSPATPWQRFRDVLDDRSVPPIGKTAFWNYNRYHNDNVADILDRAAVATGDEQNALFEELDDIYRAEVPMIPLMYRPLEFFQFNESNWTGFPDAKDPTAPPTQGHAGIKILFDIKPKEE